MTKAKVGWQGIEKGKTYRFIHQFDNSQTGFALIKKVDYSWGLEDGRPVYHGVYFLEEGNPENGLPAVFFRDELHEM